MQNPADKSTVHSLLWAIVLTIPLINLLCFGPIRGIMILVRLRSGADMLLGLFFAGFWFIAALIPVLGYKTDPGITLITLPILFAVSYGINKWFYSVTSSADIKNFEVFEKDHHGEFTAIFSFGRLHSKCYFNAETRRIAFVFGATNRILTFDLIKEWQLIWVEKSSGSNLTFNNVQIKFVVSDINAPLVFVDFDSKIEGEYAEAKLRVLLA